jgi:hypothetical protein
VMDGGVDFRNHPPLPLGARYMWSDFVALMAAGVCLVKLSQNDWLVTVESIPCSAAYALAIVRRTGGVGPSCT